MVSTRTTAPITITRRRSESVRVTAMARTYVTLRGDADPRGRPRRPGNRPAVARVALWSAGARLGQPALRHGAPPRGGVPGRHAARHRLGRARPPAAAPPRARPAADVHGDAAEGPPEDLH